MRRLSVLLLLLTACAGLDAATPGRDGSTDSGGVANIDGGARFDAASDAAAFLDGAAPREDAGASAEPFALPADPTRDGYADAFEGAPGLSGRTACFDEFDNDASGAVDCESNDCRTLASCCLDRGDCCVPRVSRTLPLLCDTLAECFGETPFAPFGSPSPFPVVGDGLAAGGDASFDSGLVVGDWLELGTERVSIRAQFERTACPDQACVASFALGFSTQTTFGDRDHVEPLVAMQVSASRDGVALLVSGREVARVELPDGTSPSATTWELVVRPEGRAELRRDGSLVASARVSPARARLVLYGHATNPSATADPSEPRVLLRSLGLERSECDIVDAFDGAVEVPVFDGAIPMVLEQVTDVSVATFADQRWLAFTHVVGGEERLEIARDRLGFEREPNAVTDEFRVARHPTLAFDEEGALHLLVEHVEDPTAEFGPSSEPLVALRLDPLTGRFLRSDVLDVGALPEGLSEPTLLFHREHAIVVARRAPGLVVFARGPLTANAWLFLGEVPASEGHGAPNLEVHHDTYLLHSTWRRGTRGGVALAASDELVAWRLVADDVVVPGTLDVLGARAASATSADQRVELHYVADDGVRQRLVRRSRLAPTGGRFAEASE
ncbi:MAG: hypothetical protein R3B99_25945 [Polyangiales bacterium]